MGEVFRHKDLQGRGGVQQCAYGLSSCITWSSNLLGHLPTTGSFYVAFSPWDLFTT